MSARVHIHWFRQDLRLADNPALTEAARDGRVLPVFILDDVNAGEFARGGASRWWLHHALEALDASLGGRLRVFAGDPLPRACSGTAAGNRGASRATRA